MKRKIVAVIENHFDQIWRRCFKRDVVRKGKNMVSYEKIERYYIDENIRLAGLYPTYKFQIESPCAVETYVEAFPEKKALIKDLYARGVLKTTNTGYVISDSNMTSPEAIIRNYLLSDAFFAEYVGATPSIANRADAFGNSAQLPQILKSFGARYLIGIYYNPYANEEVWVGLDKSAICIKKHPLLGGGGGYYKYAACPGCNGFGTVNGKTCPTCGGKGIDAPKTEAMRAPVFVNPHFDESGIMRVGGEELMPAEETIAQVEAIARETGIDLTIGHWDYLLELYKKEIEQVESGDFSGLCVYDQPDFNPNTTGGYITHIKIKQRLCECENKLLAGETLEAMRLIRGDTSRSYSDAWKRFLLCAFHDSSAGTVVDAAYEEIMELFDSVDAVAGDRYLKRDATESILLFNPTSTPYSGVYDHGDGRMAIVRDLKPYAFEEVTFEKAPVITGKKPQKAEALGEMILTGADQKKDNYAGGETFAIENEYFVVEADEKGIRKITDKRYGVISETVNGARPCEWILQSDNGSAWATLEPPYMTEPLSECTRFVRTEKGENYVKLFFTTDINMSMVCVICDNQINWSLTLVNGYDKLLLNADVDWASCSRRLMLSMPISIANGRDIYGIPGGMLDRKPYEPMYKWNGANGDWPAFRFGGVESDAKSIAVFNRGTPAYRILPEGDGKRLYISVLRSPVFPVCLHEPPSYVETLEYDALRDEGHHSFAFEIAAYGGDLAHSIVVSDAEHFARQPLPVQESLASVSMPLVQSGTASITHVKPAEDGNGIIVRITEHAGSDGRVTLSVPEWVTAIQLTDMPERRAEALRLEKEISIPLKAFEIATLRFCR